MYKGEKLNSISHLIGAVAALAGAVLLVVFASLKGDPWKIVSFSIYGGCLFLLYTFSTLYHSLRGQPKSIFQQLDHAAIYLLIAGTYTPFMLVTLRGLLGWSIFSLEWGLAIIGILVDTLVPQRNRILPIVIYLAMGWLAIAAFKPLFNALSYMGFLWVLLGGVFYTLGIVFYAFDKRFPHFHGIWHLFVLLGSSAHYVAIFLYVL